MTSNIPVQRFCILTLAAVSLISVLAAGCGDGGPKKYPVSGTVTYDGKTPQGVDSMVQFIDSSMQYDADVGKLDKDGKFSFKSTAGKKRVEIFVTVESKDKNDEGIPYHDNIIPDKYNRNSTLEVTVDPEGKNEFKFDLQKS